MTIKKMVIIAILSAMAVVSNILLHFPLVPAVPFMMYDPKDIIIVIGGFIFGPLIAFGISAITSVVEIFYHGGNYIDIFMNIISTCAFACTASFIYKKMKNKKGAIIGLASGIIFSCAIMLLWNYIVTPVYYELPREVVVDLMLPGILPFNLLKNSLNAAVALLLYKPVVTILRSSNLLEQSQNKGKLSVGLILIAIFVLLTVIMIILVINGIL